MLKLFEYNSHHAKATTLGNGWRRWWRWWPTEMATAMANGDGDVNGWWRRDRDGSGNGQQQLQRQWPTAMAMAMCDGNGNGDRVSDGDGDGNGDCNGNGHSKVNHYKGMVASSCASDVQLCGRGNILPPPPWIQRKVHSPALCHGGDTSKSVCSPSRGRVPDSSPWIVFLFIFYNYCSVYWTTLCSPPTLFRHSRTLSVHWCSMSSTPLRTPSAYWWSTPAPTALFVKVSLGRAYNDYNLTFLCWCEMTNLSATFYISQTFALSLTDNTFVIWKPPVVIVETFKVKVYLVVSRHFPAQPFCPVLLLAFAWRLFSSLHLRLAPFLGSSIVLQFHNWSSKFWKSTVLDSAKLFGQICSFCYIAL